jgi:hypothetical protein
MSYASNLLFKKTDRNPYFFIDMTSYYSEISLKLINVIIPFFSGLIILGIIA